MAHRIYQTDAFVLQVVNIGDSHQYVDVFTRELGLVRVVARSVRYEKSKLRYSVQPFSYSKVSLVRGKEVWRLTGAVAESNMFYDLSENSEVQKLVAQVFSLLRRMVQGEEKNEYLFDSLISFMNFLNNNTIKTEEIRPLECIMVLRMLHGLGYSTDNKLFKEVFTNTQLSYEGIGTMSGMHKDAIFEINKALTASHL